MTVLKLTGTGRQAGRQAGRQTDTGKYRDAPHLKIQQTIQTESRKNYKRLKANQHNITQ